MVGRIYLITCLMNSKWYFGQTIKNLHSRLREHIKSTNRGSDHKFHRAIRKYGEDNFVIEEVMWVEAPTKKELKAKLDFLERHFIQRYDTKRNGYNSTDGGESKLGYVTPERTKEKIRYSQLGEKGNRFGKKHPPEVIAKLRELNRGKNNPMFGRKLSAETRRKMSETHKRLAEQENPEQRRKRGDASRGKPGINRGKTFSLEYRKKLSESQKLRYQKLKLKNGSKNFI